MNNKEKLLFFTPHLSTGGLPQVLVNKIFIHFLQVEYRSQFRVLLNDKER